MSTLRNADLKKIKILHGEEIDEDSDDFHKQDQYILKGLIDVTDPNFDVQKYLKNFRWDDNNTFRMINTSGIEKVFTLNYATGHLKEKGQCAIIMKNKLYSDNFYYNERLYSDIKGTYFRLLRKH